MQESTINDATGGEATRNKLELGAKHTATTTTSKSDLRSTKKELFNKLISNRSHQIIVTTPNKKDGAENLNSGNSLPTEIQKYQTVPEEQQQQQQQQQSCQRTTQATSGKNSNNNSNNSQQHQFLPEDFKREPVVFTRSRSRWYTNEEVASILTNFSLHPEWQTNELQVRPKSGAVLLYSREKVRYRQDGYCWKKRKNGRTTREDHMKLKVQGIECIYGCYVHSAILPTFHRRCYWLLQNPDIVLVHYLNQPPDDQNKMMLTFNSSLLEADTRRSWTNEEIIEEIGSVFGGISQIQHTLNINFPPSTAIIQQQPTKQQQEQFQSLDQDRLIDSSPQSQQSTSNSEVMNEQVDMTILDQQQPSGHVGGVSETHDTENNRKHQQEQEDEDELMTTLSQDNNNNNIQQVTSSQLNNLDCNQTTNGHEYQQQQHQQIAGTIGMTFDVVSGGCNDRKNNLCDEQGQAVDCYGDYANNISVNDLDGIDENRDNSINEVSSREEQTNERMEQNPCSPVTQIYNKIVDDIETYALPLEPNQFNPNHHHHHHHHHGLGVSSMPVQPMDIVSEVTNHDQHQHQHLHHHQQQGQQQQQHNHHNHHHHQPQQRQQQQEQQHLDRNQQDVQQCMNPHLSQGDEHDIAKDQSACSMDLVSCDLFGNRQNQNDQTSQDESHEADVEDDNLLLTEFNLPSGVGQVSDELSGGVVDSLTNVDDLRDLIMGISSTGNSEHSNLLVDSNTLDIFNFKPSDCEQNRSSDQQHRQQLDVRSSLSDTDNTTHNRLSPMVPVPRCNSTGNSAQTTSLHLNNQHLSASNYLTSCAESSNLIQPNNFPEFHNNQNSQRSLSANPSSSTSCSPSPSSSLSLRVGPTTSSRSPCIESTTNHYGNSANLSAHSSIKLPLQQRQKSEQQEPSNSILNSLLPKALSLDGCDMGNSNHNRLAISPLIAYEQGQQGQNQSSLLISAQLNQQEASQTLPLYTTAPEQQSGGEVLHQSMGTPMSSNIPMDNSSEILVNNSIENFLGSPAYNMLQSNQQQQQQPITISSGYNELSTVSGLLPILDYVPNWSNITGGAKVLIIGDWGSLLKCSSVELEHQKQQQQQQQYNTSHHSDQESEFFAIFDDLLVPATLIQDNVLRCYAPSHEQGFITLKVLYMNRIVSEQVLFEMRPSCIRSSNNQLNNPNYPGNNQNDGQDPYNDNSNNYNSISGSNNPQQHRNSTSSNQSASASFSSTQKSQASPIAGDSISGDNSRVLTLAENIISAMHKKNSNCFRRQDQSTRLFGNSLDIEYLDGHHQRHYSQQQSTNCQRQYSHKGAQRRLTGSRSLSRDSELNSNYGGCSGSISGYGIIDGDPYWHQGPATRDYETTMQPLSVLTDLPIAGLQQQQMMSGPISGQKRHSGGSSGFLTAGRSQQQQLTSYIQRPSSAFMYQQGGGGGGNPSSYSNMQPMESQNFTETSSSGLGSIVSSLSPSTSSLHSPSSACTAAVKDGGGRENQSPCSCGRQSSRTPTSADFCEYFQASARTQESFASLTLNDSEQRELYEAAKVIQKAYRTYRGRKRQASELLVDPAIGQLVENHFETVDYQSSAGPLVVRNADVSDPQISDESTVGGKCQQRYLTPSRSSSQKKHQLLQQPQQQPALVKCYRDREMQAATIIQAYYRRYRQYVHYNRQQTNNSRQQLSAKTTTMANNNIINPAVVGVTLVSSRGGSLHNEQLRPPSARLVVDTMPIIIDKATTSHVDRKRFKTASLISGCGVSGTILKKESNDCSQNGQVALLE